MSVRGFAVYDLHQLPSIPHMRRQYVMADAGVPVNAKGTSKDAKAAVQQGDGN